MQFTCAVDIDLPRATVINYFKNPDNMQYWQDGFISYKQLGGNAGTEGAQSLVTYDIRGKKMQLTETVLTSKLPAEFHGLYEGDFGKNTMSNYFVELGPKLTRWRAEIEYLETKGFIMKMMSLFFSGIFKKQTQKWMNQFKSFTEKAPA